MNNGTNAVSPQWGRAENLSRRIVIWSSVLFGAAVVTILLIGQNLIENVHIGTTNGLGKSIAIAQMMEEPTWRKIDPSNALYYPIYAFLCKILDAFGIFTGVVWRQSAVLNAIFAGIAAAVSFEFAASWTRSLIVALLAATAYSLSGYVLLHGLNNEDIMPGFTCILLATLLGCRWFYQPSNWRIIIVAMIFAIGWLFEWRLMFPSLPPFILALVIAPGTLRQRFFRPVVFLSAMIVPPAAMATLSWMMGAWGFKQAINFFGVLLWTGKGVGTGWGGFTVNKLWLLWSGMSESIFAGHHLGDPGWLQSPYTSQVLQGTLLGAVLLMVGIVETIRKRHDAAARNLFVITGGLFAAGAVFNAYSQPQDPQMQINVMIWALPAWMILLHWLVGDWESNGPRLAKWQFSARVAIGILIVMIPVTVAMKEAYSNHGYDKSIVDYVKRLDGRFKPENTVYAIHDFDGLLTWLCLPIRGCPAPNAMILPKAPAENPRLKWIGLVRESVGHPDWTGAEHAADIAEQIGHALDLGYSVLTPEFWTREPSNWVLLYATVSNAKKTLAIRENLYREFEAKKVWDDPYGGPWFELTRRRVP
jgi:hypothetical protein